MANRELWAERVADWKASGRTSVEYCEDKPFSAGGLRHWAYRLRKEVKPSRRKEVKPSRRKAVPPLPIRMGRVLRGRARAPEGAVPAVDRPAPETRESGTGAVVAGASLVKATLVVELGQVRVSVPAGFDRDTLVVVLATLSAGGPR
jgi:hypothetical protein